MKAMKTRKRRSGIVCFVAAILLIPVHSVIAQIRIGGVTITIPKRAKTPKMDKPEIRVESPAEPSSEKTREADTKSAATSSASTQSDAWLEIILEEINKRKKEVESYDPSGGRQLVTMSTPELFLPAISLRAREAYYKGVQTMNETRKSALNPAFDSLAAAAVKKVPLYKPDGTIFAFRNPPGEQMMVRSLRNGAALRVHKIGLRESIWLIEKNEFGIPVDRYKHGYIWARDNSDDHPYCHLYTVFLQQNYAGGGTYGQLFAKLSDDEIFGCP
jgi:hypothetical protein